MLRPYQLKPSTPPPAPQSRPGPLQPLPHASIPALEPHLLHPLHQARTHLLIPSALHRREITGHLLIFILVDSGDFGATGPLRIE